MLAAHDGNREAVGLVSFRLIGLLDGAAVTATWDGAVLQCDQRLRHRAVLARQVDRAFSDGGEPVGDGPVGALIVLSRACDRIVRAEMVIAT